MGFLSLSILMYAIFVVVYFNQRNKLWPVFVILGVWLIIGGVLSYLHFFENFTSMPPRIPLFVFIQFIGLFWIVFYSRWAKYLTTPPQHTIILVQAFRVSVELFIVRLVTQGMIPIEMSFHGRNLDIITGLTAPFVAYYVFKKGEKKCKKLILVWNALGLVLVSNVVVHGMLSTPYPFQVLKLSPANFIVGRFPSTLLPLFLVPCAYYFHVISLKKILSKK